MATGQTPTYLLPYPISTDPVDVHGDIFELADRLEDVIGGLSSLPAQSGNNGKFLTTNGSSASWAVLPLSGYAPISAPSFTDSLEFYGDQYIYLDLYGNFSNSYISAGTDNFEVGVFPDFGNAGSDLFIDKDIIRGRTYNSEFRASDADGFFIKNDGGYYARKLTVQGYATGEEDFIIDGFKIRASLPIAEYTYITGAAGSSPTTTMYVTDNGPIHYHSTNSMGNFTIDIRSTVGFLLNDALNVTDTVTVVLLNTNGATAYYPTTIKIDGNTVTPKWQGGTAPTSGNANSIDAYTFVIIKTADAQFTVLGSQTKFA